MSQQQIADAIGIHQTAWSLYERGQRMPDQFEMVRLVAKLKVSVPYLQQGTLEGVEHGLALVLAAKHPELVPPIGTVLGTDTDPP